MTEQEFITKFGEESQEVTKNYATKSLGTNYDIKDAFIEFGDNACCTSFSPVEHYYIRERRKSCYDNTHFNFSV